MKILVAGAGGFIGGHLVPRLLADGFHVRAVDIKPQREWWQCHVEAENLFGKDLRLRDECWTVCRGIHQVYNLAAAMGGIGFIETHRAECMLNVLINTHLLMAAQIRGVHRYLFTSSACFAAGTPVFTVEGVKPIETVRIGDRVLTHMNRFQSVTAVSERRYLGTLVEMHSPGLPPIFCTPDHRFLQPDGIWEKAYMASVSTHAKIPCESTHFELGSPAPLIGAYQAARSRKGRSLDSIRREYGLSSVTITKIGRGHFPGRCDPVGVERVAKNFDVGLFLGTYLAEGWIEGPSNNRGQRRIAMAFNDDEENLVQRLLVILERHFFIPPSRLVRYKMSGQKGFKVHLTSEKLVELVEKCFYSDSKRAWGKTLREPALTGPIEFLHGLMVGWWLGDGCVSEQRNGQLRFIFSTTSWRLAHAARTVLHTLGIQTSMQVRKGGMGKISGRTVQCRESYHLYTTGHRNALRAKRLLIDESLDEVPFVFPEKLIKARHPREVDTTVYNLEVAEDHSYIVQGMAVHNCVYAAGCQDQPDLPALKESDAYPAAPEFGYGTEKLFSEEMCRCFAQDYGLQVRVPRLHNIYGPRGSWQGGREKAPAAICRKVAEAKLSGKHEIEIWGDGTRTRSYCWIGDCVEGLVRIMESEWREPLNLGSAEVVSVNQLVDLVEKIADVKLERRYDTSKPQGVAGRNSDNSLIQLHFGWEPRTPLKVGLGRTYEWVYDQVRHLLTPT